MGPPVLLYLRVGEQNVPLKPSQIIIFGKAPDLPEQCTSAHAGLGLTLELQKLSVPVMPLVVPDPFMHERHGIVWADGDGACFLRAINQLNKEPAADQHEGVSRNGVKVRLQGPESNPPYAFAKNETARQDWRIPAYADAISVGTKSEFRIKLDWVTHPPVCELLCLGCSTTIAALPEVGSEIVDVAHECQWGPGKVSLSWGATPDMLQLELKKRLTKRFLFSGHADAMSPSGRTL